MSEIGPVLKWAWRYHSISVEDFDTLDDAVWAAQFASDDGQEALECIEIPAEGRIIPADEVWNLADALGRVRAAESRPMVRVAEVTVTAPNGEFVSTVYEVWANAEAAYASWCGLIGIERVSFRDLRREASQ